MKDGDLFFNDASKLYCRIDGNYYKRLGGGKGWMQITEAEAKPLENGFVMTPDQRQWCIDILKEQIAIPE
ncbi:hypothetical protein IC229_33645 [Spirosoma sp. BT702]|uniref:Uncharacterized protein n=1 Tax=Spirosoma profusum TaxID=2771354 RepID=A0A927AWD5_9BACT|nr:hypothetical protein [Spirosoma profusum]MBD2705601.1 hypothetical protein [Spirosoma profusum]